MISRRVKFFIPTNALFNLSVLLLLPVGCDLLGPIPLPPGFDDMSKKAQQPWKTCQRLEQQAYLVDICFPYEKKHCAGQLYVCQAFLTGCLSKKCVSCIASHFPCNIARNKVSMNFLFLGRAYLD